MAYLLGNLVKDVLLRLGQLEITTATGGSTTTAIDTKLVEGENEIGDADYINGLICVIRAGGAAPENEYGRISNNVATATEVTFTLDAVLTAAIASGDTFAYARPTYSLYQIIEQINAGLEELGDLVNVDTTTMDTASGQTEYTWEVAWKRVKPIRLDVQGRTDDSNNNEWVEVHGFEVIPAGPGSTGLIVFDTQPVSSRDVRVWYKAVHPRVSVYSDVIHESIHPNLAIASSVLQLAEWNLQRGSVEDPDARGLVNNAKTKFAIALNNHPIMQEKRHQSGLVVKDQWY